jgi:hypothetical protein
VPVALFINFLMGAPELNARISSILIGFDGEIKAAETFMCVSDAEACSHARQILTACPSRDVWCGERLVSVIGTDGFALPVGGDTEPLRQNARRRTHWALFRLCGHRGRSLERIICPADADRTEESQPSIIPDVANSLLNIPALSSRNRRAATPVEPPAGVPIICSSSYIMS